MLHRDELHVNSLEGFSDLVAKYNLNKSSLSNRDAPLPTLPRNCILFGPPGTGKSTQIKKYVKDHAKYRVTFHPDYDYASFVGSYKPFTDGNDQIQYKFVEQEFIKAYKNAWNEPDRAHFLIIEEINRGNCAQIFGDIFQSLDRDTDDYSEYEVDTDTDLANHLKAFFTDTKHSVARDRISKQLIKYGCLSDEYGKIILPNNLYIYATMNTSDQSLFPMDSAFKRRWDWEYVPIDYAKAARFTIELTPEYRYSWAEFIRAVNTKIYDLNRSEDKQLGNRFVNPVDGKISMAVFKSKIMFYLWSEIYKNETDSTDNIFITQPDPFKSETKTFTFSELFEKNPDGTDAGRVIDLLTGFMRNLKVQPLSTPDA